MIHFSEEQALKYKELINKAAESLEDSEAAYTPRIFEKWEKEQQYKIGKRVCYNNKLYKVTIAHTSQDGWEPDVAVSLFAEILIPDPTIIPEWVQPDSTNPYMKGDKVRHNNKNWISTYDYNVWEPGVYGWEEYSE